ncbi:MAG: HEAT repeat domain-containing protein [Planctomycetes bacterium]|nr:HEAT repeat domain-containing protein [Planctomycetota bacterium]
MKRFLAIAVAALAACSKPPPAAKPSFALRSVCAEEIAKLEAALPPAKAFANDPELVERVRGLVSDAARAQGQARGLALRDAAELGAPAVPVLVSIVDDARRDPNERRTAVDLLGAMDVEAASDALAARIDMRFFHEPWLRAHAAFALGRQARDAWLPQVLPLLEHETDGETAFWIAKALAKHGNYAGVGGLLVLAEHGADDLPARSTALLAELATEAGVEDGARLRDAWVGAEGAPALPKRDPSPALRLTVWKSIARLSDFDLRFVDDARYALANSAPWVVEPLTRALREEDEHVRLHVTQCLERMGPRAKAACADLQALLDEPRTAPAAAEALGGVRCADALPVLAACTAPERAPELRAAAAHALGRLGSDAALPTLQRLLDQKEPMDLRQTAAQSLLGLGDEARAVSLLVECLASRAADQDAAESALEAWLTTRAETNAEARSRLGAWRNAGPAITGTPTVEQVAERRAARAAIACSIATAGAR